ncbi:YfjP family GTPase [Janibacter sp. G56]|uniref:YfjP family GTPase n=1 Tax=Janibacter sp. G56 TaxID=3418717 RepID=UPI003D07A297
MSPLIKGRTKIEGLSAQQLNDRAEGLSEAVVHGGEQWDPVLAERADDILIKVHERTSQTGDHTVVALAGATGSGKSSLFNAIVGGDVATIGARRPTTSTPTAGIWGDQPSAELLDWLGVGTRHQVSAKAAKGAEPDELAGLVLLDLPDFDSRETANRQEAERVLELVDVFVWVTDPQKYADARLHDDYVAAMRNYDSVTVVVLNQVDRLTDEQVRACIDDLKRLLAADGVKNVQVIPTSARTGRGVDELRQRLANAVAGAAAARTRLGADVTTMADRMRSGVADSELDVAKLADGEIVDALSRAAGVPTVVDAVQRDFRLESMAHTGWPFTRWMRGFRASPLKRLRLDGADGGPKITEADVRTVLGRSSIPPPTPAARSAVDLASRRFGEKASAGLPTRWADAVAAAASPPGDRLADELDRAVLRTPLRARNPLWWTILGALQILLALAAVVGLVWLVLLGAAGWLQLPDLPTPEVGPFAVPFVLLVGGVLLGLLLAAIARWMAGIGARRRGAAINRRLRSAISEVAQEQIIAPVGEVLVRHAKTRRSLERAQA